MSARAWADTVSIDPYLFVIFGGTGDLTRRKLLPAYFRLLRRRGFADVGKVLGVATRQIGDAEYQELATKALVEAGIDPDEAGRWCREHLRYQPVAAGFPALAERIEEIEQDAGLGGNRVFYLALPPSAFADTVAGLGATNLHRSPGWTRVVVEKPFGRDLESAKRLNGTLHRWFDESQIFRIDHYLGKETVQNLLVFRFANTLFESVWNRDRVETVQITVAESLGLEGRAGYFERAGIVRDIVQNHALQVLSLVAMEAPVRMAAASIRDEKVKVLRAIYPLRREQVVRGRYTAGRVDGVPVPGYLEEEGVAPDSVTETFAALRFEIDNWRWKGVPFVVRAGKRLPRKLTQVAVSFREPPVCLFDTDESCQVHANVLYITLQPDEGFDLAFDVKQPGEGFELRTQTLRFRYAEVFGDLPGAYETLLADILCGDQTLFVRSDEVEEAWRILGPVLDLEEPPEEYPAGSWGPVSAERLVTGWLVR